MGSSFLPSCTVLLCSTCMTVSYYSMNMCECIIKVVVSLFSHYYTVQIAVCPSAYMHIITSHSTFNIFCVADGDLMGGSMASSSVSLCTVPLCLACMEGEFCAWPFTTCMVTGTLI